jgi:UDP-N-acetylmuramate dehydrogenase
MSGGKPITIATEAGVVTVRRDQPMSLHTTFRTGGPADFLTRAGSEPELMAALDWAERRSLPVTVVGGGSNLLVGDRGIRGLVILVRAPGSSLDGRIDLVIEEEVAKLTVPAQAPISWLGHLTAARGWAGLEWAAGLPGVVGGAVVNNAGAHGGEMADHLVTLELLDLVERRVVCWHRDQLEAQYRYTVLKVEPRPRRWVVLRATFALPRGDPDELVARAVAYAQWRRQAQPTGACAGSVFTNPPGTYAGYLIEQAGLKGRQIGGVRVSERHANFLINTGNATAADVRALIAVIQDEVFRRFGIHLEPEIEEIGEA